MRKLTGKNKTWNLRTYTFKIHRGARNSWSQTFYKSTLGVTSKHVTRKLTSPRILLLRNKAVKSKAIMRHGIFLVPTWRVVWSSSRAEPHQPYCTLLRGWRTAICHRSVNWTDDSLSLRIFLFLFQSLLKQTPLSCYVTVQAGLELVAFLVWVHMASPLCWLLTHFPKYLIVCR